MIHHVKENLLKSDCRVIGHQSNCNMGFGSGIAGQIKEHYPEAYNVFKEDRRTPNEKLGSYSYAFCPNSKLGDKIVYNLYGQLYYGRNPDIVYTDYQALDKALNRMLYNIELKYGRDIKVGLPFLIGCGLGNGNWLEVCNIIEKASKNSGVDIYLYEYTP